MERERAFYLDDFLASIDRWEAKQIEHTIVTEEDHNPTVTNISHIPQEHWREFPLLFKEYLEKHGIDPTPFLIQCLYIEKNNAGWESFWEWVAYAREIDGDEDSFLRAHISHIQQDVLRDLYDRHMVDRQSSPIRSKADLIRKNIVKWCQSQKV